MGNTCQGQTADDKKKAKRSRQIDTLMKDINQESQDEVKLLLLGTSLPLPCPSNLASHESAREGAQDREAPLVRSFVGLIIVIVFVAAVYAGPGESGKSTIFKQMKIIQIGGGFSQNELLAYRYIVYGNCITQMKVIVAAAEKLGIEFESPDTKVRSPAVGGPPPPPPRRPSLPADAALAVRRLAPSEWASSLPEVTRGRERLQTTSRSCGPTRESGRHTNSATRPTSSTTRLLSTAISRCAAS